MGSSGSSPSPPTETVSMGELATHDGPGVAAPLRRGSMLGRYIVLEEVGAGGMGVVYRAYDPRLGREVALKSVKTGRGSVGASTRLFREAQAMARLTHPNVLPVYDVDRVDGDVVMSMEFVSGQTLYEFFRGKPGWARVLEVMVSAGRGLAAAHEAGLVHRDFKPTNVLVGEDDRVRVMDFGLARADLSSSGLPAAESSSAGDDDGGGDALASPLTRMGTVIGTPPYMAPEQFEGGHAGARSDQYSFCVTVYEGLWGTRPFDGVGPRELQAARLEGPPRPPSSDVPSRVVAAIERGLDPDPEQRFVSMDALLAELRPPAQTRQLWIAGSAVLLLGAVATAVVVSSRDEPCAQAGAAVAMTWDGDAREALRASLSAEDKAYAEGTFERVGATVDGYADELRGAFKDACLATHRGEQSAAMLDLRTHCVERRRQELSATLDVLVANPAAADKALDAVSDLPPMHPCADPEYTRGPAAEPVNVNVREAVAGVRGELATVRSLRRAGRWVDAFDAAQAAWTAAEATDHAPVQVEARAELGLSAARADKLDVAQRELSEAYFSAGRVRHDDVGVETALALARLTGHEFGRAEEGAGWIRHAKMLIDRGPENVRRQVRLRVVQATLDVTEGRYAAGAEGFRAARALLVDAFGDDHPEAASLLRSVAVAESHQGHFDAARILSERAIEAIREAYGPEHPYVPDAMRRLASVLIDQGELDAALQWAERALAIERRVMGERSRSAASTMNLLGTIQSERGEVEAAVASFEAALAINRDVVGANHGDTAGLMMNVATGMLDLGRLEQAQAYADEGLAALTAVHGADHPHVAPAYVILGLIAEANGDLDHALAMHARSGKLFGDVHGPTHPYVAGARFNQGRVLLALSRDEDAVPLLRDAAAQWERIGGASHPQAVLSAGVLGEALVGAGERQEGLTLLERSAKALRDADVAPSEAAAIEFALALALWSDAARRDEARTTAKRALNLLAHAKRRAGLTQEKVQGWLESHS